MFLCLFYYLLDYERKTRNFTSFFEMDTNKKAVKRTNFERFTAIFWSRIRDSNPPPTAWEAVALPDELTLQVLHYCNKAGQECQGFSARNLRSAHFGPSQVQHREERVEYQVPHAVCQQQTFLLRHQGHYGAAFQQLLLTLRQQGAAGFAGLLGAQSQPVSVYSISIAGQAAALSGE